MAVSDMPGYIPTGAFPDSNAPFRCQLSLCFHKFTKNRAQFLTSGDKFCVPHTLRIQPAATRPKNLHTQMLIIQPYFSDIAGHTWT